MTVGEFFIAWHQAHDVKIGFESQAVQDSYTLFMSRFCAPSAEMTADTMMLMVLSLGIFHDLDDAILFCRGKGMTVDEREALVREFETVVTSYEKNKSKTTS